MKRIDYQVTVDATSTDASETIETLATEKSNGNITGYTVKYQDYEGKLILNIWQDFPDEDDPTTHYDKVNTALSNLPVPITHTAEKTPIRYIN